MNHKHTVHPTELAAANEPLRQLVDCAGVILWRKPAGPGPATFVNAEARRVLGFPLEHWLTDPDFLAHHLHPDDRDDFRSLCESATAQQGPAREIRMFANSGEIVSLSTTVRRLSNASSAPELVGVMTDVTYRGNLAGHDKSILVEGDFLAVMSHEIRTP